MNAIEIATPQAITTQPSTMAVDTPESLIRFALERGADVGTMERLLAMRRELKTEQAKEAFHNARSQFQSRCPVIVKCKAALGRDGKPMYHYAPLDAILEQTKSLREELGFSHSFSTKVDAGWVECICTLTHREGHSEASSFKVPATSKSPMMSDPQMYASALTFLQRYTFCASLGIATAMEDTDAKLEKQKQKGPMTATPAMRERMIAVFKEKGLLDKAFEFAINRGLIMPNASLETWPLDEVPTTKGEMDALLKAVNEV